MKLYEYTKYQKFFKKVYWGNFDNSDLDMTIIYNRNDFIEDNNIIKVRTDCPCKIQELIKSMDRALLDHYEIYESYDEYIVIVSPYTSKYIYNNEYKLFDYGFKRTNDLYSKSATTYILKINK